MVLFLIKKRTLIKENGDNHDIREVLFCYNLFLFSPLLHKSSHALAAMKIARVKVKNAMNSMKAALLRAGIINEEYLEEAAKKARVDKFWEDPSMDNLLELDVVPQELKAKIALVAINDPGYERIQILRLDLNTGFDVTRDLADRNLLQSHHRILWMDSSGNVHNICLQERDIGKVFTKIVGSDATCVLTMYYSIDLRRPTLLGYWTDVYSVELFLA